MYIEYQFMHNFNEFYETKIINTTKKKKKNHHKTKPKLYNIKYDLLIYITYLQNTSKKKQSVQNNFINFCTHIGLNKINCCILHILKVKYFSFPCSDFDK